MDCPFDINPKMRDWFLYA